MPRSLEVATAVATIAVVLLSRLAHQDLVWIEEAYGMAAAGQMLRGAALYRDIWFDKPPVYALYYAALGAQSGFVLRSTGTLLVLFTGLSAGLTAQRLWAGSSGVFAFALTCFSLTFWVPSAVIAVTPDTLMIAPHFLAVAAAVSGYGSLAGIACGVALWCNSKALFVLAVVLLWTWRRPLPVLLGVFGMQIVGLVLLDVQAFWTQVWEWGIRYSQDTFIQEPALELARRTGGWIWFHATLVVGSGLFLTRASEERWRFIAWTVMAMAAVIAGLRFFPRYYFALLPPVLLMGVRGLTLLPGRARVGLLFLLLIPLVRFGPRYIQLLRGTAAHWSDIALMNDSRNASAILKRLARPYSRVLVWGYRPDAFVFSGLPAATRYLDSQPLTGVLGDRHILDSRPTFPELATKNRAALVAGARPEFIVDGLGLLNPQLAITNFPDLQAWLSSYRPVARTAQSVIYQLQAPF